MKKISDRNQKVKNCVNRDPFDAIFDRARPNATTSIGASAKDSNAQPPTKLFDGAVRLVGDEFREQSRLRRFRFYSSMEVPDHVPSEPIIPGFLFRSASTGVYAPAGVGKTHLGVDTLSTISQWGLKCLYVSPEDPDGTTLIMQDWRSHFGVATPNLHRIDSVIDLTDYLGEVADFVEDVRDEAFDVILIDGITYCLGGKADGNTDAMTAATIGITKIATELRCAVLINAHTGWDENRERGATQLRGCTRVMAGLEKRNGIITLAVRKTNRGKFTPKRFKMLELPTGSVLVNADAVENTTINLDRDEQTVLNALNLSTLRVPASVKEIAEASLGTQKTNAVYPILAGLQGRGLVELIEREPQNGKGRTIKSYELSVLGMNYVTLDPDGIPIESGTAKPVMVGPKTPFNWTVPDSFSEQFNTSGSNFRGFSKSQGTAFLSNSDDFRGISGDFQNPSVQGGGFPLREPSQNPENNERLVHKIGPALWSAPDGDIAVRVTGLAGMGSDGRAYVTVEGSDTAVPVDELTFADF